MATKVIRLTIAVENPSPNLQHVNIEINDIGKLVDSPLFVVNGVAFSSSAMTPSKPAVNQVNLGYCCGVNLHVWIS